MRTREHWRRVPGYSAYEVSNRGRLRSWQPKPGEIVKGRRPKPAAPHALKGGVDKDGYRQAILIGAGGRRKSMRIAQLVAKAFGKHRRNGTELAHQNGRRHDNAARNLAWKSHTANMADKRRHGTHPGGENHPQAKLTRAEARTIRRLKGRGVDLARRFDVSPKTISAVRRGRTWRDA